MPKSLNHSKQPPAAFGERNRRQFQRTVQLTRQAIERLVAAGQPVTLAALCEATREVNAEGKALSAVTILRNPAAAALFRQHSPTVQECQSRARKAKRNRAPVKADTRALYRGLRTRDLIGMIEHLTQQLSDLKQQQDKLAQDRAEAYQLRDEALKQNTYQLATLTVLQAERTIPSRREEK